eukprot:TRINITY_DN17237_c0_g1_i1.p1 TRINITY_DN17237_c0_g1~~TRINITY_DN17237_c0_g1_i1.p1  ORF type:complete len:386 (-),score=69.64 TRINITY_DN17237_c0_g1_i1:428-1585(-)
MVGLQKTSYYGPHDDVGSGLTYEPYGQELCVMSPAEVLEAGKIAGTFAEPPGLRKDYQDAVRVAFYRQRQETDAAIAARLKLPVAWVKACNTNNITSLPVPKQLPPYVADHGLRCLENDIEPFRPAELRRNFVSSSNLVHALSATLKFEAAPALKRDYATGKIWDTGHKLLRERCSCGLQTGVPSVDRAIAQLVQDYAIDDPGAYLLCNRYKDGRSFIAPHQHDFWSATFSFGAPRVFLLDKQALVLNDGDVLIFGSQRHSVPKMPHCKEERISLSLFWYPNWRSECDYSDDKVESWQASSDEDALWAARRAENVERLANFGFSEASSVLALSEAYEDVDVAAEALLRGAHSSLEEIQRTETALSEDTKSDTPVPSSKAKGRWRR